MTKADPETLFWRVAPDAAAALLPDVQAELQIPDSLQGVFPITENLLRLEQDISLLLSESTSGPGAIFDWARAVQSIDSAADAKRHESLTAITKRSGHVTAPLLGCYSNHPLWCALWFRHALDPSTSDLPRRYEWIQAHYLAAHVLTVRRGRELRSDRHAKAGLAVRKLQQHTHAHFLDELRPNIQSPRRFHREILRHRWRLTAGGETSVRYGLGCLLDLVKDGHDLAVSFVVKPVDRRSSPGSRDRSYRSLVNRLWPDHHYYWFFQSSDGVGTLFDGKGSIRINHPGRENGQEIEGSGLDPEEFGSYEPGAEVDIEEVVDDPDTDPGHLPPLASLYAAARAKARHVRMRHQRLSVDVDRIRTAEIADLVSLMSLHYQQTVALRPSTKEHEREQAETLRALRVAATSIVTGMPAESIKKAHGFKVIASVKELPTDFGLAFNPDHRMWIRPYEKPERSPMLSDESSGSVETWPRVVYPDTWGVTANLSASDALTTWTSHHVRTLKERWEAFVKTAQPQVIREKWLRFSSLSGILPSWFRSLEEGDHLAVALLFHHQDPLAQTHHFYTTFDREALARQYQDIMTDLGARVGIPEENGQGGPQLFQRTGMAWEAPKSWVGNDRVLRTKSLRTTVSQLRALTARAKTSTITEYHNHLTLYTALGLALATGFRAVRTPIIDLSAIHHETRTLCLQEKDRLDGAHARWTVLPESVYLQTRSYLDHLRRLWVRLPEEQRASLEVAASKNRDRSQYGSEAFTLELNRTLFFFEQTHPDWFEPAEFTGTRMTTKLNGLIPGCWPVANAGRHVLRTWLTQSGAAPAAINVMMGHAGYGEESWAAASAMDPVALRKHLLPHLEALADAIDYRPIDA